MKTTNNTSTCHSECNEESTAVNLKKGRSGNTFSMTKYSGFTLVELIVVITILVILGTIAFTSLTGFSSNARDSDRVTTLKNIESGLDIHRIKSGQYPTPENISGTGTIDGTTILSSVGEIGDSISRIIKMNTTPKDPLDKNSNYTYGTNANKTEYQIATTLENPVVSHLSPIIQTAFADSSFQARVNGNYLGYIKFQSGTTNPETWIANIPSLLFNNTGSTNLLSTGTYFIVNKQTNLPYKIDDKTEHQNKNANEIIQAITNTTTATLTGVNITGITTSTGVSEKFTETLLASFGGNLAKIETAVLGKSTPITPQTPASCATQPTYTSVTFTQGTPTQPNQAWQSNDENAPCYWTCGTGKTLVGNDCVSENCSGTDPNTINAISNATSTAGGTWNYNTDPGLCTYACNTNYTVNGSNACTDQTAPTLGDFTVPATTNSTGVTLTITCPTDAAGSTPIQMYISGAGLASGGNVWESCVSSKNITVTSGDGSKTLTMKWRDSASIPNETIMVSRSVNYAYIITWKNEAGLINQNGKISEYESKVYRCEDIYGTIIMSKGRDYVKCDANWVLESIDNTTHKCYNYHWGSDTAGYLYTGGSNANRHTYYTTDVTTNIRASNCN